MQHATVPLLAEADYLSGEAASPNRHEYVAGRAYAMAGASKAHNIIALDIASRIRQPLRGSPCRSFIAGMKVRVGPGGAYYYPDAVVTCSGLDTAPDAPKDYLTAPALIVEVLSESTEAIDRREKMQAYAMLESLQEYLLLDSRTRQAELYRKLPGGGWEQWAATPGEALKLGSLGLELPVDGLYEDAGH
jgi:Uma2 family endonuclease